MQTPICEKLGIEFPLFAFSHCRDVVVEVSKAGGFGVLGAVGHTPESLEIELTWIDEHINGKPYGVDLIVPTSMDAKEGGLTVEDLEARIPEGHKRYVEQILAEHGIPTNDLWEQELSEDYGDNMRAAGASMQLDTALRHPVKLVVNALGVPPPFMIEAARERSILVGALAGSKQHAIKHGEAGLDIVIAAGGEAGGHCGEIATMVLVPEVVEALAEYGDIAVLGAGGIVTGRQMAACMTMGAQGVWTGSVWLTTAEAETHPVIKDKMLSANSRQTVRSRSRTGKYTRQLRSPWTDAWQAPEAPDPLPMPLQGLVSGPALVKIDRLALAGDPGAKALSTYWVGQGVGLMNETIGARTVVYDFMQDWAAAAERLSALMDS
ncbi:MAG: nitronate monooxygenase family protein [Pseudomonadales bacterium]|jgi:NAD(P)H-dependent flavin oxidoreductase YrpB (nitropropane dioxygenase family)|nr:nitronate monooxygenase family protein [Pseudomonadales bacterium]MDP6472470.1 nitronate monooxygenase family protein [Pseudomonadales bacterium]MDP6828719.1 nitronate monooxygenase family protein [Pseudomonadales bacterium]MDP6971484.1 nitronate monooxygenase family protein [Pseudomonadales bacterium]|tara:strand:+ start:1298 stop:2434 length:1137 start_codon:yes stop_codon:yes gene_type:complete